MRPIFKKTKTMIKEFNLIISGVGGQGLLTLLGIISQTALNEGYDVKTSELHGLSQRGGSVETHLRFGKKIHSPLVRQGKADLILALEMQEALKPIYYANNKTIFLLNKYILPISGEKNITEKEILDSLKKFSSKIISVPANDILKKELNNAVTAGIFMLVYAVNKKLLPLKEEVILKTIKKIIPEKYWEINKKTIELAKK